MDIEDLGRKIHEAYVSYINPIVGEDSRLAKELIEGLDKVLNELELPIVRARASGVDYSHKGPEVKDGNQYTVEQILDMSVNDFVDTHREHSRLEGAGASMARYFNGVGRMILKHEAGRSKSDVTIREAIGITPTDKLVLDMKQVGKKSMGDVNQYLQNNYGISLGMKL